MFTGIVEEMGTVRRLNQAPNRCELELTASKVLEGTAIGDSIAVNGVCLTGFAWAKTTSRRMSCRKPCDGAIWGS